MGKVKVTSMSNNLVGVKVPELHFRRTWTAKGMSIPIEEDVLEELMFDPGFKYMIDNGILYIDDMETKKKLELEPEEATAPVNIIVLKDADMRKLMIGTPMKEFKETLSKISREQINNLADYAIKNHLADYDKCKLIKERCGRDIVKAIQLGDAAKE